jgi:Calcium binding
MFAQESYENMGDAAEDAISIPDSTPDSIEESAESLALLPTGDPDDLDEEREVLVVEEMERIKEDLMADAYGWSEEECWRMHVEGSLDFPFQAVTPIRKRDGSTETHILDVIGPAISETGVMGEFALVLVDFRGLLLVYNVFDLEPLDMSDRMLSALQTWQFSQTGTWTIFNIQYGWLDRIGSLYVYTCVGGSRAAQCIVLTETLACQRLPCDQRPRKCAFNEVLKPERAALLMTTGTLREYTGGECILGVVTCDL